MSDSSLVDFHDMEQKETMTCKTLQLFLQMKTFNTVLPVTWTARNTSQAFHSDQVNYHRCVLTLKLESLYYTHTAVHKGAVVLLTASLQTHKH